MPTLRLSLGLLLLVGLTACSQSFWERPRVAGQVQPSPYAAAPAPQVRTAPPPASTLPPPQVRPSQTPPTGYAQPAPMQAAAGAVRQRPALAGAAWSSST